MGLSGKIALIKRWLKIVTRQNCVAIKQGEGKNYSKDEIAGYYNDLTGKVNSETLLDDDGIPMNEIAENKRVYFPISVFQYGLGLWDLTLDDVRKKKFLCICQWSIDNQRMDGSWDCFGPIGYTNQSVSAMGQGEAVSLLLRAYKLTGMSKWYDAAKKAIYFMIKPIEDGGTLFICNDDVIFEEYANKEGDKRSVLNGWIFSLFGVLDWIKASGDKYVLDIYKNSLLTLKRYLSKYDTGYWSFYDLTGRLASPAYHDLHICLLNVMYDLTDEAEFKQTAEKWKAY